MMTDQKQEPPVMLYLGEFTAVEIGGGHHLTEATSRLHLAIDNFEGEPGEYVVVCMRKTQPGEVE